VFSLAIHEYGHAASAVALGDQTPREQGRLTLNPVAHMDWTGTVLLPLALIFAGLPVFGWAKPVEITPYRFTRKVRMRTGLMFTAAAGPFMNLLLAALSSLVFVYFHNHYGDRAGWPGGARAYEVLIAFINVNVSLCLFNLIPVPPLDGSRVVGGLLPNAARGAWTQFEKWGPYLLLPLVYFGGNLLAAPRGWLTNSLVDVANLVFP
jgi:Zn-dependent protease